MKEGWREETVILHKPNSAYHSWCWSIRIRKVGQCEGEADFPSDGNQHSSNQHQPKSSHQSYQLIPNPATNTPTSHHAATSPIGTTPTLVFPFLTPTPSLAPFLPLNLFNTAFPSRSLLFLSSRLARPLLSHPLIAPSSTHRNL